MLPRNTDVAPKRVQKRTTPTEAGPFYAQQRFSAARTDKESCIPFYTPRGAGRMEQNGSTVLPGRSTVSRPLFCVERKPKGASSQLKISEDAPPPCRFSSAGLSSFQNCVYSVPPTEKPPGKMSSRAVFWWWRRWESNPCPKGVQREYLRVQAINDIPSASRRSPG